MQRLFRRIAVLFLALISWLAVPAAARESAPPAPAATGAAGPARPALWKVSDADTTIYLFGTIHALPKGVQWFGGPISDAFDSSQELVTEITETDPAQMQQLVIDHAMLPQGESLRTLLPAEVKTAYEAELGKMGMPAESFDGYEPWYAAIALSTLPLMRQGYDSANGVEQALDTRAKSLGRPHSALETPAFQIGLFDALPMDAQKRYFAEVVKDLPQAAEQLNQIVAAWQRGDADNLAKLMNAEEDDPVLLELLLISRNRTWASWIKQRLDKPGTVFVAVGAGHLAGKGSVQEQLAAQGISAQRVQ